MWNDIHVMTSLKLFKDGQIFCYFELLVAHIINTWRKTELFAVLCEALSLLEDCPGAQNQTLIIPSCAPTWWKPLSFMGYIMILSVLFAFEILFILGTMPNMWMHNLIQTALMKSFNEMLFLVQFLIIIFNKCRRGKNVYHSPSLRLTSHTHADDL